MTDVPSSSGSPHTKRINMHTYKFHALGDYVNTIKLFSTMDSYTTQIVRSYYVWACLRSDIGADRESALTI